MNRKETTRPNLGPLPLYRKETTRQNLGTLPLYRKETTRPDLGTLPLYRKETTRPDLGTLPLYFNYTSASCRPHHGAVLNSGQRKYYHVRSRLLISELVWWRSVLCVLRDRQDWPYRFLSQICLLVTITSGAFHLLMNVRSVFKMVI
jgi:hypothetical protein